MKILFLDQSGKPGGAELCLLDVARPYRDSCLVGLLADGSFRELLEQNAIPVEVLTNQSIQVQKDSSLLKGLLSLRSLLTPIRRAVQLSHEFDVIYANTQKALVVGAIASFLSRRPLVYHLHDIVSAEHFSRINQTIIIQLANQFASAVIANSEATEAAFIQAGGRAEFVHRVYNGFNPDRYIISPTQTEILRHQLQIHDQFVVGHFSRLAPWKGQHVLIEALAHCPADVVVLLVGDALFGEQAYVEQLHHQIEQLGLQDRVRFLGFRSDIPQLMAACNLVAHTSTAPEPFGRVIVEAMLCGTPVVATAAGGVIELIEPEKTGWLAAPGDTWQLAAVIDHCYHHPAQMASISQHAKLQAVQRFHLEIIQPQIAAVLQFAATI